MKRSEWRRTREQQRANEQRRAGDQQSGKEAAKVNTWENLLFVVTFSNKIYYSAWRVKNLKS
jgi:hypothetical protein